MQVIFGLAATALLAVFAKPACSEPSQTVCIIRGGTASCYQYSGYWEAATGPETETPGTSGASLKTIVLQPSAPSGSAWVMQPQSPGGATDTPACSMGVNC